MRKVLILGDTHADTREMVEAIDLIARLGWHDVVVVGDFGYWPKQHPWFLRDTSKAATDFGVTVWWVDGNHEDFGRLYADYGQHHDSPVEILPGVMWLPRGVTWEWESVKFMAMGGAASIDRAHRTLGVSWFVEEMISNDDVARSVPCDIVIAHDSPVNPLEAAGHRFVIDDDSEFCRQQMRHVVALSQPELVLHGHYHMSSDLEYLRAGGYTRSIGLGCNGNTENKRLLTLDNGTWRITSAFPVFPGGFEHIDADVVDRANARLMG